MAKHVMDLRQAIRDFDELLRQQEEDDRLCRLEERVKFLEARFGAPHFTSASVVGKGGGAGGPETQPVAGGGAHGPAVAPVPGGGVFGAAAGGGGGGATSMSGGAFIGAIGGGGYRGVEQASRPDPASPSVLTAREQRNAEVWKEIQPAFTVIYRQLANIPYTDKVNRALGLLFDAEMAALKALGL